MKMLWMTCCFATLMADSKIEVVKMEKTPHNERALIHRMYTESGTLGGKKNPLVLQVIDFPVGVSLNNKPDWLKGSGMRENAGGSSILIWVYGPSGFQKRFYLTKQHATPFVEDRTYFKDRFRKYFGPDDLPKSGKAVVIAILVNAYGESLKMRNAVRVYVVDCFKKSCDDTIVQEKLKQHYLVYNEPYGNFKKDQPILLDFYVPPNTNTDIGSDAYTVDLYIDNVKEETLKEWVPYRIRGLKPGNHEIKLILIDPSGNPVLETFGEQKNTISVDDC